MRKSTISSFTGAAFVASALLMLSSVGCTNTRYGDLMRVTAECDAVIVDQEQIYRGSGSIKERLSARERIVRLREKQMIMAQRINVNSMPEVSSKSMTYQQGQARKAELVQAATARYNEAVALPMPTAAADTATAK